jgi:hypothetical protein
MSGVEPSSFRAVGVLEGHPELNTIAGYNGLIEKDRDTLLARMEHWMAGNDGPAQWFHNFKNTAEKYRLCFVFKVKRGRVGHRFYGYLCHPKPKSDPGFQLCVLCIYTTKTERETDTAELDRVVQWSTNPAARKAIAKIYPEYADEGGKWKN